MYHEPLSVELRRAGMDAGAEHWVHLAGRAQMDEASNTVRLVGCAWDSTPEHDAARLLAAKESAEFASRSKSAFLSRMSHELRTPLNAILGFSQLMRMEAEAGDLTLKPHRVVLIETAARHLLELINEVLDVSRVESGQLELRLLRFDLRDAVRECLPLVLGQAEAAGITIEDQTASGPPLWVLGDRLRLKEVLINLLSNAVKYNSAQGRVDISARDLGERVELTVTDTGRGLDEKQLAGLFQPFNRLGAEALGVEGSGMGLFVSKRFVDLMGGGLDAASAPGQGTTFTVTLNAPAN
jgi:signal transduction histidine kinase